MRRLIKWLFILAFVAVAIVVGLVLSKDAIAKAAVEQQIRSQTGMDVKIEKFSVGVLSPVVNIQNLKLYNTPEFGGTPFIEIKELHLEFDRASLAERKLRITLLRLDLASLTVVRSDTGSTNLAKLSAKSTTSQQVGDVEFTGIDVANLSVGKIRFLDLKNSRNNREFNAGLRDQVFRNIKTTGDLYGVLMMLWLRSGGSLLSPLAAIHPADESVGDSSATVFAG